MSEYQLSKLSKEFEEKKQMRRTQLSNSPNLYQKLHKCKKNKNKTKLKTI